MTAHRASGPPPRYCFIGGLHRSGTTLLANLLGKHEGIAGLNCPYVPENEGVYLQGAIPHTARHGIPGEFAHDPEQHLTEDSRFNSAQTASRIEQSWAPWFDQSAAWRVEKSPVNLLRPRLYQQLFPLSQFIVITRHPFAVAQATRKWSSLSNTKLVAHWDRAHAIMAEDLPYLHCALVIRYEDLVAQPVKTVNACLAFLGLPGQDQTYDLRDGNLEYSGGIEAPFPGSAARLGYDPAHLNEPLAMDQSLAVRHHFRSVRDAVNDALA